MKSRGDIGYDHAMIGPRSCAWVLLPGCALWLCSRAVRADPPDAGSLPAAADLGAAPDAGAAAPVGAAAPPTYVRTGTYPAREQALAAGVKVVSAQKADLDHDGKPDELLQVRGAADALVVARQTEAGWRLWLVATAAPGRTPRWKPAVWAGKQVLLRYVVDIKEDDAWRFEYVLDLLPLSGAAPPTQVFAESTPGAARPAARQTWRFLPLHDGGVLLETSDHRYRLLRVVPGADPAAPSINVSRWSSARPAGVTLPGKAPLKLP